MQEQMQLLFSFLSARKRPEDVAALVKEQLRDKLNRREEVTLRRAARGSSEVLSFGYTTYSRTPHVPSERRARLREHAANDEATQYLTYK